MTPVLRLALLSDVAAVVPLLNAAYGPSPTFGDRFPAYLALEPEGWVVAEDGVSLLGVGGFVVFGACAYIGLIAVAPTAQRRGLGAVIVGDLLARCEARGITLVLLDASDAGAPLYTKLGFCDRGRALSFALERHLATAADPGVSVERLVPGDAVARAIARLDAACFGADRSAFVRDTLARSPDRVLVAHDAGGEIVGYVVAQRISIGPCIARSTSVARALITHALALPFESERVTWLVPEQNGDAIALARSIATGPVRQWRHMRRGDEGALDADWTAVFGKASLAVG